MSKKKKISETMVEKGLLERVEAALPIIAERMRKAAAFSTVVPMMLSANVQLATTDNQIRMLASDTAPIADLIPVRAWEVGMTTVPGDLVHDPEGRFVYIFTGEQMTHSNPTFFPGAQGVFYWTIIPKIHEGYRVFPNIQGIIVAVRRGEIWWNSAKTARFRWNAVDNFAAHWQPGAPGVHQWVEV